MNSENDNYKSSLGETPKQNQRDFTSSEKFSIEEILNKYFFSESDATREVLHAWFLFALSTQGRTFQTLDETQFAEFKALLDELLTDLHRKEGSDAT
jgi:hypothetical protein